MNTRDKPLREEIDEAMEAIRSMKAEYPDYFTLDVSRFTKAQERKIRNYLYCLLSCETQPIFVDDVEDVIRKNIESEEMCIESVNDLLRMLAIRPFFFALYEGVEEFGTIGFMAEEAIQALQSRK